MIFNRLIFIVLAFIIFFTPLAFGTVDVWAQTILQLSILLLLLLYILKSINRGIIEYRPNVLNAFFVLFILYLIFQIYFDITKVPYRTILALKSVSLYFAFFFVIVNTFHTMGEINNIIFTMVLVGSLCAVLGILQHVTEIHKMYWIKSSTKPFGPFPHGNYFASYISMITLLTLGSFFSFKREKGLSGAFLKQKLLHALNIVFNKRFLFTLFSFILMITALFFATSGGGAGFFLAAALFFAVSLLIRKRLEKVVWIGLLLFIVMLTLFNWLGFEEVKEEFYTLFSTELYLGRMGLSIPALAILKDYPLFGIGIGTFRHIFPMYRLYAFSTPKVQNLHNDFLQLLIEGGWIGFFILSIPILIFIAGVYFALNKTRSNTKYIIGLSLLSSFLFLALHSTVDFPARLHAVTSLLVIYLALSTLVINLHPSDGTLKVIMKARQIPIVKNKPGKLFLYVFMAIIFAFSSFYISKPFIVYFLTSHKTAFSYFDRALSLDPKNSTLYYKYYRFVISKYKNNYLPKSVAYVMARDAIEKAMELDPYNSSYRVIRGRLALWHGDYKNGLTFFKEASLLDPNNGRIKIRCAYTLFVLAFREKDEEKKSLLLKRGLIYYGQAGRFRLSFVVKDKEKYKLLKALLKKEGLHLR